ncbi:class I SAM-dependent methyltransferase [Trinickia caryophylli]|uniref:Methyltransferase domain-containing protein n=1 Tax=Trinickia caryophylli TaxID=28094 RepID=A0A1X7GYJ2_TRICW|nr:class I SAM-dependent methyltransferase [Trinickia caryophylli]PMS10135.1 class I SAM-dependent methyltransferase [Trinickia caryophylli]TRX18237.1 class I SAM-dependent methyltransferase [Trinickia caryophylli]WQE10977.1 class I SAM-dependent methyltransferase [Trinickia caryophylli]SMF76550.1 Methyltransferase domain-containing protein [Trinickia caryophylli]GLU35411.1 SAM-dependent methyltransferase [Trinickia caryophylli]
MKHQERVADAFGSTAAAYLTSPSHASGADLKTLAEQVAVTPQAAVLDLGCGAGHVSFAVAPHVRSVIAYDLAEQMLATVLMAARERGFTNIATEQGAAERLPFADASFDWVLSRFSAHHWHDVPRALSEVRRVLKPGGRVVFVDVVGADHPMLDTHLQAAELLRDGSHIRNYRADEWMTFFEQAGFAPRAGARWRLPMQFDQWVARMRTPEVRVAAIRSLWAAAPDEVREYFAVQPDGSFEIDVQMIEASAS